MPKTIAYIRTSTNKQEINNQKFEILEYARKNNFTIDDYVEISSSSKNTQRKRRITEVLNHLDDSDVLIATELSRLGRSTSEVINLINDFLQKGVRVILIKQKLDITTHDMSSKIIVTLFALFGELERDLISVRTKEALASKKAKGTKLGKPFGTVQKSMYDKDLDKIKSWIELGLSGRKISDNLGYGSHISLNTYINKRNLRS